MNEKPVLEILYSLAVVSTTYLVHLSLYKRNSFGKTNVALSTQTKTKKHLSFGCLSLLNVVNSIVPDVV